MSGRSQKGTAVPRELEGAATVKDVSALESRVEKCYSTEKYEEFQKAVKAIALETIEGGDGRTKIKVHARESVKEFLDENGWKKLVFWAPLLISVVSVLLTIYVVYHAGHLP